MNGLIFRPNKAFADHHGTYHDFGAKLNIEFGRLKRHLTAGRHEFSPYIHKIIKTKGKERDVYLADWPDKIVEKWLSDGLNTCLAKWFSPNSYAYRPGKFGLDLCQNQAYKAVRRDSHIIRRDITSYFYSIPHDKLINKLTNLVDPNDSLFRMLVDRIKFKHSDGTATIGIPFGSPLACVLANIYLTDLDHELDKLQVSYFRYADDILIISSNREVMGDLVGLLDERATELELEFKPSHTENLAFNERPLDQFKRVNKFKFLGMEFTKSGDVRLSIEKQRKIVNLFKREFNLLRSKLKKVDRRTAIRMVTDAARSILVGRIRSTAIIDYYLKHASDMKQLKDLDLLIAQEAISAILGKPFRYKDFGVISYRSLRNAGFPSLVHRHRLHHQGHLHVDFLSHHNELVVKRHFDSLEKKKQRIDQMAILRKLKQLNMGS